MSEKIEVLNTCSVRGVLAGGRAICGMVGCGEPWKCWSEEPCDLQVHHGAPTSLLNPKDLELKP